MRPDADFLDFFMLSIAKQFGSKLPEAQREPSLTRNFLETQNCDAATQQKKGDLKILRPARRRFSGFFLAYNREAGQLGNS